LTELARCQVELDFLARLDKQVEEDGTSRVGAGTAFGQKRAPSEVRGSGFIGVHQKHVNRAIGSIARHIRQMPGWVVTVQNQFLERATYAGVKTAVSKVYDIKDFA
jgi:hypothetical protein